MNTLNKARKMFDRQMNGTSRDTSDWLTDLGPEHEEINDKLTGEQGKLFRIPGTNRAELFVKKGKPGQLLINIATVLLFLLIGALFAISWWAQYKYVLDVKHQSIPAMIEASTLDAGQLIFSLLAIGLARAGMSAKWARTGVIACALMSAVMNFFPSNSASWGSIAAYVFPPLFLAYVVDTVVIVIRRHVLGEKADSSWKAAASVAARGLKVSALLALYCIRLVLAPKSTVTGMRLWVLNVTPLPEVVPVITEVPNRKPKGRIGDGRKPKAITGPRPESKRAQFLKRVEDQYGDLAGIELDSTARIAKELHGDLHEAQARTDLRKAVLAARGEAK